MTPKTLKKEAFWFIGALCLGFLLAVLSFNIDGFHLDTTLDINIYDTYFVLSSLPFALAIIVLTVFVLFLVRSISAKFQSQPSSIILMLATMGLLVFIGKGISLLAIFGTSMKMQNDFSLESPVDDFLVTLYRVLFSVQIALMLFLVFLGIKFGQHLTKNK